MCVCVCVPVCVRVCVCVCVYVCVCVCVCCGWVGVYFRGGKRIEYYSPVRPALSTLLFSVSGARKVQWASGISGAGGAQDREGKGELTAVCRGWRNFGVRADSGWIREGNGRWGSRRLKSAVKFGCRHPPKNFWSCYVVEMQQQM